MSDRDSSPVDHDSDGARVEQLASLDDVIGGLAENSDETDCKRPPTDSDAAETPVPLEAMLLLRQVAATERGLGPTPPVLPSERLNDALPTLPPYEVVCTIGHGGFSTVYKAVDPRISRSLALKVIRPEAMLMPGMRRRFLREAEIAARLNHPNIVIVHDVGAADGRVFIAQELCSGGSLADWLAEHTEPVPPRDAATFMIAVAEALRAAHAAGVVHRDLKPANILLVPRQASSSDEMSRDLSLPLSAWQPKIADFGLATLQTDDSGARLTKLTVAGCRLGTPAWMAPEQVDPSFGTVGPATDIYALGLLLERLLKGNCTQASKTDVESFRRILLEPPVPADHVVAGVSADLAAVGVKCLAKRPAERYASAAELADELRCFITGRPTKARPLSWGQRTLRRIASAPMLSLLAALVVLTGVVAGGLAWDRHAREQQRVKEVARAQREQAADELQGAFNSWRSGNVAEAMVALQRAAMTSPAVTVSLAAHWLETRLHGEDEILFQAAPDTAIYGLALQPGGDNAAVAAEDGTLAFVSLDDATAKPPLTVDVHDEINDVTYTPDGGRVAAVGQAGTLSVWNVATGEEVHRSSWGRPLFGVAASPNGQWLALGGEDCMLRIVRTEEPDITVHAIDLASVRTGRKTDSEIESIAFIDDAQVAVAFGHQLVFVDRDRGDVLQSIDAAKNPSVIDRLRVSPDRTMIFTAGGSERVPRLWNSHTRELIAALPRQSSWTRDGAFSPDNTQLAIAGRDGVVRVFDTATRQEVRRLVGHVGAVWQVEFENDASLLSAGSDGTVRRWNLERDSRTVFSGLRMTVPPQIGDAVAADSTGILLGVAAFQRAGTTESVVVVDPSGTLHRYDPRTETWVGPPITLGHPPAVNRSPMLASPAGDQVAVSLPETPLAIIGFDGAGRADVQAIEEPDTQSCNVCWTSDEQLAVSEASGKVLYLVGTDGSPPIAIDRSIHDTGFRTLAAAQGPRLQLLAADHDRVRLHTLDSAGNRLEPDRDLPMRADDVVAAAWSPDGRVLACGVETGSVWLFDIATQAVPRLVTTHWHAVRVLAFDRSGQTLLSADSESVRLHDTVARVTYDEFIPGWEITGLALPPDEDLLFISGSAGLCTIPLAPASPASPGS